MPLANVLDRPQRADELTAGSLFGESEQFSGGSTRR
jgi:hypothetical protein